MSTLAEIRDRVEAMLMDTANAIWSADVIDEAIRQALDEYNQVYPLSTETVITLPGDGREIALNSVSGLIEVLEVWWPYDSDASDETWPPNKVKGFRLWWDDAQPVLFLDLVDGSQPQGDDELRIWHTRRQTIQDLDSGDATTLQGDHETALVKGAAGHAALFRTADLVEVSGTDLYAVGLLGTWGRAKEREWSAFLESLRKMSTRRGPGWGQGWRLDKWDTETGGQVARGSEGWPAGG
jgi:hypothetical protein